MAIGIWFSGVLGLRSKVLRLGDYTGLKVLGSSGFRVFGS